MRLYVPVLIGVLLWVGCDHAAVEPNDGGQKEEHTREIIMSLVGSNPNKALAIIDSVEEKGGVSRLNAELMRAQVYSYDESTIDTSRILLEHLLRQDDLTLQQEAEILEKLVYVSRMRQNDESVLKYGTQYIDVYHQLKKNTKHNNI